MQHVAGRGVRLVLAVVAAVTLVALAARGDHADRGSGALRFSSNITSTTQAMAIIAFGLLSLGVVVLLLSALSAHKPELEHRPIAWRKMLITALIVLCVSIAMEHGRPDDGRSTRPRTGATTPSGSATADPSGSEGATPAWGAGAAGVLLIVLAGAVVLWRRRDQTPVVPARPVKIATPEEQEDAIALANACTDPRQAVLLSFAAAEAVLSADPRTRRPAATSAREWSSALALAPLATIVSRYEIARFSDHEVGPRDRTVALDALGALT